MYLKQAQQPATLVIETRQKNKIYGNVITVNSTHYDLSLAVANPRGVLRLLSAWGHGKGWREEGGKIISSKN